MAKKKMPPQLLEYFKKKNKGDEDNSADNKEENDKGKKAEEMAKKGLKSAKAAKKHKDKNKE
jgi:hypothetical protein|tara:strand:+ start:616 stop:801 length:186 start_codon:yes stop_codon:yes gene_type:complete